MNAYNEGKIFSDRINHILILLFLIHGSLYLIFPQDVYNNNSVIKYIKYILLLIMMIINFKKISMLKTYVYLLFSIVIFIFTYYFNKDYTLIQYLTYICPISLLVFKKNFYERLNLYYIVLIVVILTSSVAYLDFYVLRLFNKWLIGGEEYREVSIFINPNTMSITISILSIYLLYYWDVGGKKNVQTISILLILNCMFINILSGSKTGLLLFISMMIFTYLCKVKILKMKTLIKFIFIVSMMCIFIIIFDERVISFINSNFFEGRQVRAFSMESGQIRLYTNSIFIDLVKNNFIFPFSKNTIGVDNLYFHLWGTFGIFVLILYLFVNAYILYRTIIMKSYFYTSVILFFALSGVTTNFLYLWPLAYMYFYILGKFITQTRKMGNINYEDDFNRKI